VLRQPIRIDFAGSANGTKGSSVPAKKGLPTFDEVFLQVGKARGDSESLAHWLLELVPKSIRSSEAGIDALTNLLRYKFGDPFREVAGMNVFGTHQLNEVWQLYVAIVIATSYLTRLQLDEYLLRLGDESKHNDALIEMRPIARLPRLARAIYEVPGNDNKKIDWHISFGPLSISFDVKNRVKGAIGHFKDIAAARRAGMPVDPPRTDAEAFFSNTENKFPSKCNPLRLQGVWAHVLIKESAETLKQYFQNEIDPRKIDFLIIAGWTQECFILARTFAQKAILKSFFKLKETDNWTFYDE
jgi:hypothetical protein